MKDKQKIQTKETTDYGFTEVKQSYQKNLTKGLLYAVAIYIVVLGTYFVTSYFNKTDATEMINNEVIIINIPSDIEKTPEKENDEVKTMTKDNDEIVKTIKDLASLEPVPVKQDESDKMTTKTQDELEKVGNNVGREGDSTGLYSDNSSNNNTTDDNTVKTPIDEVKDDLNKIYNSYEVGVAPECVNLSQVKGMMQYPEIAREINEEGKVTVKVLVGPDGNVIQVGKLTGKEIFFDEVKDKAQELQFKPGLMNNKPVKVWVTIPFNFKLK